MEWIMHARYINFQPKNCNSASEPKYQIEEIHRQAFDVLFYQAMNDSYIRCSKRRSVFVLSRRPWRIMSNKLTLVFSAKIIIIITLV